MTQDIQNNGTNHQPPAKSRRIWVISFCVAILAMGVYMIPSPIDPKPYIFEHSPPKLEGALAPNTHLLGVRKLFEGRVYGPESFTADTSGVIYTGCADGKIWGFKSGELNLIAHTGKNYTGCGSFELEPECGRPKGMAIDKGGNLIVVDAYLGLLNVSLPEGQIEVLLSSDQGIDGIPFKFLNGLDLSSDGIVYFTDSSTKWDRRHHKYEVIETNNYGRLMAYNLKTRQGRVLLSGLYLANGVALSPDESFILIAEMSVCRIRKFHLKGPKAGQSEVLMDNLPGYPDNIKRNSHGNFFVGLASVRYSGASIMKPFLDLVAPYPFIKRFIAKVTPFFMYNLLIPKHAILLEVNGHGDIITSHHDPRGKVVSAISEAFEHQDQVYIGHFTSFFIGEIPAVDLFGDSV